jgi:hypothetical protein
MNQWFSPELGVYGMSGDFETYAMGFDTVPSWQFFVRHVQNLGYRIYGRRIGDEDNVSLKEGSLWLDVACDMPKERFLSLLDTFKKWRNF